MGAAEERVIGWSGAKHAVPELMAAYEAAKDAREAYTDAINAVATATGLMPSALKKFVAAKAADKCDMQRRESEQLSLLFAEMQ